MKKLIGFVCVFLLVFSTLYLPASAVFLPYVHHTNRGELEYRIELGEALLTADISYEPEEKASTDSTRLLCPSPTPRACSDLCPSSQ